MQLGSFGKCVNTLCVVALHVSLIRFLSGSRLCRALKLLLLSSSPPALCASVFGASGGEGGASGVDDSCGCCDESCRCSCGGS